MQHKVPSGKEGASLRRAQKQLRNLRSSFYDAKTSKRRHARAESIRKNAARLRKSLERKYK